MRCLFRNIEIVIDILKTMIVDLLICVTNQFQVTIMTSFITKMCATTMCTVYNLHNFYRAAWNVDAV